MSIEAYKEFTAKGFTTLFNDKIVDLTNELQNLWHTNYFPLFNNDIKTNRNIIKRFADDLQTNKLFINEVIVEHLNKLGIKKPVFCGPLVSHFTSNGETGNSYGLPLHQDWPSMVSSKNSVICWISLLDTSPNTHGLSVATGKHLNGVLPGTQTPQGYLLDDSHSFDLETLSLRSGELLFMSPFLPHKTFVHPKFEGWKLSLSRRFDDLNDASWKERKFSNAYINHVERNHFNYELFEKEKCLSKE